MVSETALVCSGSSTSPYYAPGISEVCRMGNGGPDSPVTDTVPSLR